MNYPGRVIKAGEPSGPVVGALIAQLAGLGYRRASAAKQYDAELVSLVKLFQAQHVDAADAVAGILNQGASFQVLNTAGRTRWYLSVFVCAPPATAGQRPATLDAG